MENGSIAKAVKSNEYYAFLLRPCAPDKRNTYRFQIVKSAYMDLAFGVRAVESYRTRDAHTFEWSQEWEYHVGDGSVYT